MCEIRQFPRICLSFVVLLFRVDRAFQPCRFAFKTSRLLIKLVLTTRIPSILLYAAHNREYFLMPVPTNTFEPFNTSTIGCNVRQIFIPATSDCTEPVWGTFCDHSFGVCQIYCSLLWSQTGTFVYMIAANFTMVILKVF